jgi:plastocyanin
MRRSFLYFVPAVLAASVFGSAQACLTPHSGDAGHSPLSAPVSPHPESCPCPAPRSAPPDPVPNSRDTVVEIQMFGYQFIPFEATVVAGTTVRWINLDPDGHDTVSGIGNWDSGFIPAGESFSLVTDISNLGNFDYECTLHGGMVGILNVVEVPEPSGALSVLVGAALVALSRRSAGPVSHVN